MTLPVPPEHSSFTKADLVIKGIRDLGFPIVISVVLLYSVLYQIPRNETAINNARNALLDMNTKLEKCCVAGGS